MNLLNFHFLNYFDFLKKYKLDDVNESYPPLINYFWSFSS